MSFKLVAISGNPSFLTSGKIAHLLDAKIIGIFKTVLSVPSSNFSIFNDCEKTAKNILSRPIDVSITYGVAENSGKTNEDTYTAFNAYYLPEGSNLPSVSVGYELGDIGGAAATVDEKTSFMVGLSWDEVGPGSAGIAVGHSSTVEGSDEEYQYEAYYSYPINDGMTITPLIYSKDNATSNKDDSTGVMVKTSFSF